MSNNTELTKQIDSLLPQTQCQECGYKDCISYAKAIANDDEGYHLCAPGGETVLNKLAKLLKQDSAPYLDTVKDRYRKPSLAKIDESLCIGCVKCIKACPVDAIIGTAKQMHTVLNDQCTGCNLCVEPCPMDCISMIELPNANTDTANTQTKADIYRERYQAHQVRLQKNTKDSAKPADKANSTKNSYVLAALQRVKQKKDKHD